MSNGLLRYTTGQIWMAKLSINNTLAQLPVLLYNIEDTGDITCMIIALNAELQDFHGITNNYLNTMKGDKCSILDPKISITEFDLAYYMYTLSDDTMTKIYELNNATRR